MTKRLLKQCGWSVWLTVVAVIAGFLLTFLSGAWISTLAVVVLVSSLAALVFQLRDSDRRLKEEDRRDTEYRKPDAEREADRAGEMIAYLNESDKTR